MLYPESAFIRGVVMPFRGVHPTIGERVVIMSTAAVTGDVVLEDDVSLWFSVAIRGDVNYVRIGARSNIQDGAVIHVTHQGNPTIIGHDVTVGHAAVLHACTIEPFSLIGMNATVLDGAVVETGAMVAAGALVTPGKRVLTGQLWGGSPAKMLRDLTPAERDYLQWSPGHYVRLKETYRSEGLAP